MNYGWIAFYMLCTEDLLGTCEELPDGIDLSLLYSSAVC